MDSFSLLSLLADGQYHSGSELGEHLGVTRAAVWKALSKLGDMGVNVESHKGRGYRIPGGLDLLNEHALYTGLPSEVRHKVAVSVLNSIASTNQFLLEEASLREDGYTCVFAEQQTQGRGRRGRKWVSPLARNIYFSCGFQFDGGAEQLAGLSLAVGVAVAESLRGLGVEGVALKWPNDVWLNGRKLAGILVELRAEPTTVWHVVLGVGLNVHMDEAEEIDQPWIALSEVVALRRNDVAAALLMSVVAELDAFRRDGFANFASRWKHYDALEGKQVKVLGSDIEGIAQGVDSTGALILQVGSERMTLNAGEVSVRRS